MKPFVVKCKKPLGLMFRVTGDHPMMNHWWSTSCGAGIPKDLYEPATEEEAAAFILANPTHEELVARVIRLEKLVAEQKDLHR